MRAPDLAGWLGAVTLLTAYAAVSARWLPADSRASLLLNVLGSLGLGTVAASHRAWPSLALNAVWLLIALGCLRRGRSAAAAPET